VSQERTERDQAILRQMRYEQEKGYTLAGEMEAGLREIDRLNSVITDTQHERDSMCRLVEDKDHEIRYLTVKVQERDKEIERLKAEAESALKWGQEQRDNAKALKQAWYDALPTGDAEATAENMRAEIERLRAGITAAIEKSDWAESDDNEFPRLGYLQVKDILRAALKGAE